MVMREVMRNKRNGFTTRILREDKREKGKLTPDDNGNVIGNLARATTRDIPVSQKEAPSTTWRSRGDHVLDKSVTCPPDRVLYSGRPVGLFRVLLSGCILAHYMLHTFTHVMSGLQVDVERMQANLNMTGGLIFSQRILLALIDKGVGRQEAYKMVQRSAKKVWRMASKGAIHEPALLEALSSDPEVTEYLSRDELAELMNTDYYVKYIDTAFTRVGL